MLPSHPIPTTGKFKNHFGKKFGKLTVISFAGFKEYPSGTRFSRWNCECECGNIRDYPTGALLNGVLRQCWQCGINYRTKHGKHATKTYRCWISMKSRCSNKKHKMFYLYGGRGISVCDRWLDSFENFLADVGECPPDKKSLDRFPNKNGNYEPGNCRWATAKEQSRNMRRNKIITFNGVSKCVAEWAEELGIHQGALRYRLDNLPLEEALTMKG